MILEAGQHVKCLLKTGIIAEGIIIEWANCVQLKSLEDESILIIHHPDQDIVLTKIVMSNPPKSFAEAMMQRERARVLKEMQEKEDQKEISTDPFNSDYNKNLVELRAEAAEQERQIIANKLKTHYINDTKKVNYEQPGFLKKPRTK